HDLARLLWLDAGFPDGGNVEGANLEGEVALSEGSHGHKPLSPDTLLITDCQTWSRKSRTHRALIRTPEGTTYLNVPVVKEDRAKPIHEVRIDQRSNWINPLLRTLEYNYRNSVFYDFYEPEIRTDLEKGSETEYLSDYSEHLWSRIFTYLELSFRFGVIRESERARSTAQASMGRSSSGRSSMDGSSTVQASPAKSSTADPDEMAETMGADCYVQEWESRHYMRQGDRAATFSVDIPAYRQHFEGFEPDCCLLDLLFQMGPESFRVVEGLTAAIRVEAGTQVAVDARVASDAQEENRAQMEFHQPETNRH
ncbi:MAG: WbqC family protein, partial [Balneolaceae bacterium]